MVDDSHRLLYHTRVNKMFTMTIKLKKDAVLNVDLDLKTQNVANELVRQQLAVHDLANTHQTHEANKRRASPNPFARHDHERFFGDHQIKDQQSLTSPSILTAAAEVDITVTHFIGPMCFFAQLAADMDSFATFEQQMQDYYSSLEVNGLLRALTQPSLGKMCMARYSDDNNWYRAAVTALDDELGTVRVFFVDYGNDAVIELAGEPTLLQTEPTTASAASSKWPSRCV